MAIQDLHGRDYHHLAVALLEARRRNASLVPEIKDLIAAMNGVASNPKPMESWSDLGEVLVPIIGESIKPGIQLLLTVLIEKYGDEYVQELWLRFSST